jgi:peptidoglycan/xylan/chitin deacetylase (PgdA/CDA1 family)
VVVTFDDGYADNLRHAKPLLERYDVPATVFLATGYVGRQREFWWDELDRVLLQPGVLPEALNLSCNGRSYGWELGEAAHFSEAAYRLHRSWKAWEDPPTARHALYCSLWEMLLPLPEGERRQTLDDLRAWAGAQPGCRPTHEILSVEEALALAQGELIEVGAHTVTHSALSGLPADAQREEIEGSRDWLENVLDRRATSFAYPFGRRCDYTAETVGIVREAGFSCACSNFSGTVGRSTATFELPRVQVHDMDGEAFARWLSGWFHGAATVQP